MPLPLNVNLASKFESKLDAAFKLSSYTDGWINKDYDFDGVNKITVYTLDTAPVVDYDVSNNMNRYGGFSEVTDTINEYILSNDKAFQKSLDKLNMQDSVSAKTPARWMAQQMNFRIVPMIDEDRFETAFAAAQDVAGGGGGTQVYDKATILDQIFTMGANLDELSAPDRGRVLFIDSYGYKDIKSEVLPILSQTSAGILHQRGLMGEIDGLPIVKVPSSLLPENCRGLYWHKDALLAARKLTETKILDGAHLLSGHIMQGRFRFDSWALKGYDNARDVFTKYGTFQALTAA